MPFYHLSQSSHFSVTPCYHLTPSLDRELGIPKRVMSALLSAIHVEANIVPGEKIYRGWVNK